MTWSGERKAHTDQFIATTTEREKKSPTYLPTAKAINRMATWEYPLNDYRTHPSAVLFVSFVSNQGRVCNRNSFFKA